MEKIDPVIRFFWEGETWKDWQEPLRRIYDCELVYVSEGEFTLMIEEKRYRMRQGWVTIIPPATWHEGRLEENQRAMRHCIHFDWTDEWLGRQAPLMSFSHEPFYKKLVHPVPSEVIGHLPLVMNFEQDEVFEETIQFCLNYLRKNHIMARLLFRSILDYIVYRRTETKPSEQFGGKTARSVLALKHYIDNHYSQAVGYPEFRRLTQLSRSHLCQAFTRHIGRPPNSYLNDVRLHHAANLLRSTSMNIAEIGRKVGISDANYFSRLFRKKFGAAPRSFLQQEIRS